MELASSLWEGILRVLVLKHPADLSLVDEGHKGRKSVVSVGFFVCCFFVFLLFLFLFFHMLTATCIFILLGRFISISAPLCTPN